MAGIKPKGVFTPKETEHLEQVRRQLAEHGWDDENRDKDFRIVQAFPLSYLLQFFDLSKLGSILMDELLEGRPESELPRQQKFLIGKKAIGRMLPIAQELEALESLPEFAHLSVVVLESNFKPDDYNLYRVLRGCEILSGIQKFPNLLSHLVQQAALRDRTILASRWTLFDTHTLGHWAVLNIDGAPAERRFESGAYGEKIGFALIL